MIWEKNVFCAFRDLFHVGCSLMATFLGVRATWHLPSVMVLVGVLKGTNHLLDGGRHSGNVLCLHNVAQLQRHKEDTTPGEKRVVLRVHRYLFL